MSWIPKNSSELCTRDPSVSACAPAFLSFMSFVVQYFGQPSYDYATGNDDEDDQLQEFDFIIVGAGSAGCVLANRLSEISDWKILLLEAGIQEPAVIDVPSFSLLVRGSNIDWGYHTQPGKYGCRSKINKGCPWPRGKVLGGSSTINQLIYIRGHPLDYDNWANLGNPGWSYEEVLPYFRKSENNRNLEVVEENPEYHGVGGYQNVEYFPYTDPNTNVLLDALKEIGYDQIDVNGKNHTGSVRYQFISKNGMRQSTNGAFINSIIKKRPNLVLRTEAYVTKLIIEPKTKKAIGVEYVLKNSRDGKIKKAFATKEVIVSAGAINSPKLLMLSGIGPRKDLEELGIKVIKDSPVGKNLQDHPTFLGFIIKLNKTAQTLVDPQQWINDSLDYLRGERNLLAAMGVLSSGAFVQTPYEQIPDYPDIQITFGGLNLSDYISLAQSAEGPASVPIGYYSGITVRPQVMAPRSRGYLKLNQEDPLWGDPLLYPNYFEDPRDLDVIVAGVRIGRKLFNTTTFRENGFELFTESMPACRQYKFDSDDYWKCTAMEYTDTNYHCVGTCKMGPKSDPEAVVDAQLRVYGVESLRVVDASIFPVIMRGNTNAPTIMGAEKISDAIKKIWLGDKCESTGRVFKFLQYKFRQFIESNRK